MNELVKRYLTPIEIKQRQVDHLRLLTEIDTCESEIQEHRRNAKDAATEMERIKSRERQLRSELRDGCVFEVQVRQQKLALDPDMETEDECSARTVREEMRAAGHKPAGPRDHGISATTDEPDPETDPPEHDKPELLDLDDAFGKFFGRATDHEQLHADLACVLQNQGGAPSKEALIEAIGAVGSTYFDEAAHWTRMQLATMNRSEYPEFEPYLPSTPQPMPRALQAALKASKPKKPRAPRRPKGVDLPLNG